MDVSQYLEIFIDESAEHLQTLSDCIMELEKEPDNKDVINEIFRAAHSLKGMAGTMGFKRMQHLTHDMENVFQEVRSEKIQVDSQMIDLLFKCLDAIDGYLENIKATSDEGEEDNEVIIKELNNFLAKANGEAVAAEAAPAETEKEAAAPTDNGDHKLYLQIDLTDQERDAVMTAKDSGMHIYGMTHFWYSAKWRLLERFLYIVRALRILKMKSLNRNSAFMSHHRKALTRSRTLQRMFPRLKMPLEKN